MKPGLNGKATPEQGVMCEHVTEHVCHIPHTPGVHGNGGCIRAQDSTGVYTPLKVATGNTTAATVCFCKPQERTEAA